ncbi:MAG: DEAD/DEAH box helicase [Bacteroidales bacterium]|jgi:ATP-dependent RNA helicase RhlE|nr:DEAD/DEAH box helicase [Bacteroidales bacterium]
MSVLFEELNLNKQLLNSLNDLGYIYSTPIQSVSFPVIMSGRDVIGIAQTGTGKTLAYTLPLLRQLKYADIRNPRIVIIVPTRELVQQVVNEIKKVTTYMTVRVAGIYGGTNINTQKEVVLDGLDILVATPGRLLDIALSGELRFKSVQKLIIDEVDEMLNLGFRPQLKRVLDLMPVKRQNLMFSATMNDDIEDILLEYFNVPEKIEIVPTGTPLDKINQAVYHVPNFFTKVNLLEKLLISSDDMDKVLVFVANKRLADRLYEKISHLDPEKIGVIHSNKSQNNRFASVRNFESGELRILIATDIIARGLDIKNVSHVINFDMPDEPANYIHRIGRTGRADKRGEAISFVNEVEMEYQMNIETFMKQPVDIIEMPEDVQISDIYTDEERPVLYDKDYLKPVKKRSSSDSDGFHEKKDKNKKVNLGGSYKRKIKAKYKKPKTRGQKPRKKR